MAALMAWSLFLGILWDLNDVLRLPFSLFATFVGWRFVTKTLRKDDQKSCYYYYVCSTPYIQLRVVLDIPDVSFGFLSPIYSRHTSALRPLTKGYRSNVRLIDQGGEHLLLKKGLL